MLYFLFTLNLVLIILVFLYSYKNNKQTLINLYQFSKALDTIYANQDKILELTKIKSFVELVSDEEVNIKSQIKHEKEKANSRQDTKEQKPV